MTDDGEEIEFLYHVFFLLPVSASSSTPICNAGLTQLSGFCQRKVNRMCGGLKSTVVDGIEKRGGLWGRRETPDKKGPAFKFYRIC
jgi:hypothetical protein